MLKNSSKLIFFDKNNMALRVFLKSYLILKMEKMDFFKKNFKQVNKKNNIFFWQYATCYWLIN